MQVTEHVHALRVDFVIRVSRTMSVKRFVYVYFIVGEQVHLIDAGVASSVGDVESYLTRIGRSLDEVSTVALTHCHPDHIGGLKTIQSRSGCRVLAHTLETPWVEDTQVQVTERPMHGFDQLVAGDVAVDQQIGHGDCVELEPGLHLQVIHTPGHSHGSVSYLLEGDAVLFTGDAAAFAWGIPVYDDVRVSVASVTRLLSIKPVACLLSSWDEPRFGDEVDAVLSRCLQYLQMIHEAVRSEVTDPERTDPAALCRAVFARLKLPAVAATPVAARSLMSHMPYLDRADIIGQL